MFDLLFGETEKTMSSDALDDMLFSELQDTVFAGEEKLYSHFVNVVSSPLTDRNAILKRQEILRDLLATPRLVDSMYEICRKASSIQEEGRENLYQKIDSQMRLRFNYRTVQEIFDCVSEFGDVIRNCQFHSADLNRVKNYFQQTNKFIGLYNGLSTLVGNAVNPNFLSGEVAFNELSNFMTMTIYSFDSDNIINESSNT